MTQRVRIPAVIKWVGGEAFQDCTALRSVFFRGDAPDFYSNAFEGDALTAYYPKDNETWTEEVTGDTYGGDVVWKEFDGMIPDDAKERAVTINYAGTATATFYLYDENGDPLSDVPFTYVRHGEEYAEEMNDPAIVTDMYGGYQFSTPYLSSNGKEKEVEIWFDQIVPLTGEKLSTDFKDGLTIKATVTPMTSEETWTFMLGNKWKFKNKLTAATEKTVALGGDDTGSLILKTNPDGTQDLTLSLTLTSDTQKELAFAPSVHDEYTKMKVLETKGSADAIDSRTYSTTIYGYGQGTAAQKRNQQELVKSYFYLMLVVGIEDLNPLVREYLKRTDFFGTDPEKKKFDVFDVSDYQFTVKVSGSFCTLKLQYTNELADTLIGSTKIGTASGDASFYTKVEKIGDSKSGKITSGIKTTSMKALLSSDLMKLIGVKGLKGSTSMNDIKTSVSKDGAVGFSFCNYDSGIQDVVGWDDIYQYHSLNTDAEAGKELMKNSLFLRGLHNGIPLPTVGLSHEKVAGLLLENKNKTSWSDTESLTRTSSWEPDFKIIPSVEGLSNLEVKLGLSFKTTHGWKTEVSNGSLKNGQTITKVDSASSMTKVIKGSDRDTLDNILGIWIPDIVKDMTGLFDGCEGNLKKGVRNGAASIKKAGSNWTGCIVNAKAEENKTEAGAKRTASVSSKIYFAAAGASDPDEEEKSSAHTVGAAYQVEARDTDGNWLSDFDDGIELTLSFTDEELRAAGAEKAENVRIYRYDNETNIYELIDSVVAGNNVTGEIFEPGAYLLAAADAPQIQDLRCAFDNENGDERWKIEANVASFAGISRLSLSLDGEDLVTEDNFEDYYDRKTGAFSYGDLYDQDLEPGIHTVKMQVTDRQGEQSLQESFTFTNEKIILEELSVPKLSVPGGDATIRGKIGLSEMRTAEDLFPKLILVQGDVEKEIDLELDEDGSFSHTFKVGNKEKDWDIRLKVFDINAYSTVFEDEDDYGDPVPYHCSVCRRKTIYTDEGSEIEIDLKTGTVTRIIAHSTVIKIPGTVGEYPVKKIGAYLDVWESREITEIVLPDSVTEIGEGAFAGLNALKKVTLPANLLKVGECAFYNCENLKEITLPDSVTEIGEEAFGYGWNGNPIKGFVLKGGEKSEAVQEYRRKLEGNGTGIEVTEVTLSHSSANVAAGKTLKLSAEVLPVNAADKTLTWTSSAPSIASVDGNGLVTAKKYGTAVIAAQTANGLTATCEIQVLFADVANSGKSYFKPVYWAVDKGITVVTVNFRPEDPVTRGEFVAFLWRVAGKPKSSAKVSFKDVNSKTKFYDAIRWAVGKGIIKGYSDGTFKSDRNVTRGETATMIWRYAGKPAPKTKKSPFSDLKASNADSYKAILWGSEKGIIKGSKGQFLKNDGCTRGQVVTFLYRYVNK